jgi:hypothetical protein
MKIDDEFAAWQRDWKLQDSTVPQVRPELAAVPARRESWLERIAAMLGRRRPLKKGGKRHA